MVFPGVQDPTWSYDRKARAYYFHRFYDHQPNLNMDNPQVRAEVRRIIGFGRHLGVAEFRRFLQWRVGDAILLGEANVPPEETLPYFRDELDLGRLTEEQRAEVFARFGPEERIAVDGERVAGSGGGIHRAPPYHPTSATVSNSRNSRHSRFSARSHHERAARHRD